MKIGDVCSAKVGLSHITNLKSHIANQNPRYVLPVSFPNKTAMILFLLFLLICMIFQLVL